MRPGQYYFAGNFTDTISVALTAEVSYAVPVDLDEGTLDRIGIQVTVGGAGSHVQLGLFSYLSSDNGGNGLPGDLLEETQSPLDTSTTGTKEAIVSWDVPSAGRYWLAAKCTNGTPPEILAGLAPPWSELPQGTSAPSDATWAHSLTDDIVAGDGFEDAFVDGNPGIESDFGPQIFFRFQGDVEVPPDPGIPRLLAYGGSEEPTDTFLTEYITPAEDALVLVALLFVGPEFGAGATTVDGCGLSFDLIRQVADVPVEDLFQSTLLLRAMGSPTGGQLEIVFPETAQYCFWYVVEFPDVETSGTNGEDAFFDRGFASEPADSGAMNWEMDGPFDDPANIAFSIYALPTERVVNATNDWIGLGSYSLTGKGTIYATWQPTEDALGFSDANVSSPSPWVSIGLEIVRA